MDNFILIQTFENGGRAWRHALVSPTDDDYSQVEQCALSFAEQGKQALILPKIKKNNPLYVAMYGGLMGTKYQWRCPDLSIDGIFYEVEGYRDEWRKRKLCNMIGRGLKQASHVIIDNTNGASDGFIYRCIYSRIKQGSAIDEVWLYEAGRVRKLYPRI
jgi:hypothetical protein